MCLPGYQNQRRRDPIPRGTGVTNRQAPTRSLCIAVTQDSDRLYRARLQRLSSAEKEQVASLPTELHRRQSVIGRIAAHNAIQQTLDPTSRRAQVAIVSELGREPRVLMDGAIDRVRVSISHSSHLAVACAWLPNPGNPVYAGIDLERLRPNDIADSTYAFSRRERTMLARAPEGPEIAALAAWTAKEAVWKALLASQRIGPNAIDIKEQCLANGYATVQVRGELAHRLGDAKLSVRNRFISGPDGRYILSLACVIYQDTIKDETSISLFRTR